MAAVKYHATLIYGTNTIELWNYDDTGALVDFDTQLSFSIARIDGTGTPYTINISTVSTANGILDNGGDTDTTSSHATFILNIPTTLQESTDTTLDYDRPTYDHIYSVKGVNTGETYLFGNANLIEVA